MVMMNTNYVRDTWEEGTYNHIIHFMYYQNMERVNVYVN